MLISIETSCDESALALFDAEAFRAVGRFHPSQIRAELISSQVKLHEAYGGVVPELAAREHLRNLPLLVDELFDRAGCRLSDVTAVAATQGPGLKGSLIVGFSYAKTLSYGLQVPLIPVNHLEGHLWAAEMNEEGRTVEFPALALVVSGGHTMLVLVHDFKRYETIARTRDDAAGEAFDKVAAQLNLPYPGGPALSKCGANGDRNRFQFATGVKGDDTSFSFSGLKTAASRLIASLPTPLSDGDRNDVCASVEWAIVSALVSKTLKAVEKFKPRSLVLTGGVAANRTLRSELTQHAEKLRLPLLIPPAKWCTDNAAMIGVVALKTALRTNLAVSQGAPLGPLAPLDTGVTARFPIDDVKELSV